MYSKLLLSLLFLLLNNLCFGTESKDRFEYEWTDESHKEPTFQAFKNDLRKSISKKDVAFIKSILYPEVITTLGFYKGSPIDFFMKTFQLIEHPEKSPFWDKMNRVLDLGCAKHGDMFLCPYINHAFPGDLKFLAGEETDGLFLAITKASEIKSAPDSKSKTIGKIGLEVVRYDSTKEKKDWDYILPHGRAHGYVPKTNTYNRFDRRAIFRKINGSWKLFSFNDGD